jgi:hypothetical protein
MLIEVIELIKGFCAAGRLIVEMLIELIKGFCAAG